MQVNRVPISEFIPVALHERFLAFIESEICDSIMRACVPELIPLPKLHNDIAMGCILSHRRMISADAVWRPPAWPKYRQTSLDAE